MKKFHVFRSFQRNKKGWMAALTLLAIISFLFLGVIIQLLEGGRSGGQASTIAESRRYGKVNDFTLHQLQESHVNLQRFLTVLYQQLEAADPADEERRWALLPLGMLVRQMELPQSPEHLVNVWLVTQYAQEEGFVPNWDDVENLLRQLTGGHITKAAYDSALRAVGLTHPTVERLLVRHLLWQRSLERFSLSIGTVSPATRWDWYQRLYRQITIEAAAVPVASFINQVGEPSERQLTAFFEAHKRKRHNPESAEVGFVMPAELAFQYVVARPTQTLLDSITEEEMLAYYEENKADEFLRPARPPIELPALPMMPTTPGGTTPFPTPIFPAPGRVVTPTLPVLDDLPPTDEPAPPDTASETPMEPTPMEPTPAEPVPAAPEPAETEEESAEEPSESSAMSRMLMQPALFQLDSTNGGVIESPASPEMEGEGEGAGEPVASADSQSEEAEESTETEPAKEEPSPTETAEPPAPPVLTESVETESVEAESMDEAASEPTDLSVLYRPFDDVKEEIRVILARNKARELLPGIQQKMQEYFDSYHTQVEQGRQPPPLPDLAGFVADLGLELVDVPMGNLHSVLRTDFARGLQQHIVQMFYVVPLPFDNNILESIDGAVLYWIVDQKLEKHPEHLNEVRDIVLQRWKEVEARSLAQKRGEELADEARASGRSLAETFAQHRDVSIVETEPFTWKTYGYRHLMAYYQTGRMPELDFGEVRESGVAVGDAYFDNRVIDIPGTEFMETVYSLQVGEMGVVFNQPQTFAYVVRVTSSSPSTDALWERFQTAQSWEYLGAGRYEMERMMSEAWLDEIRAKTGFRWVNKPDPRESGRY